MKKYHYNRFYIWDHLCSNTNPKVIPILKYLYDNIPKCNIKFYYDLYNLCKNTNSLILSSILNYSNVKDLLDTTCYQYLCSNPCDYALEYVSSKINKLNNECWRMLCKNTNSKALDIISKNISKLNDECIYDLCLNSHDKVYDIIQTKLHLRYIWKYLCLNQNSKILELITNNLDKLDNDSISNLCMNPRDKALEILENNLDMINKDNLYFLALNKNHKMIDIMIKLIDKLDNEIWSRLSNNPYAYKILLDNPKNFEYKWDLLCKNTHDKILELISNNVDKLDSCCFEILCENSNPKALEIILNNLDKINKFCWNELYINLNILSYDYDMMKNMRKNMINIQELNNIRLNKALYYKSIYGYDMILDEYII